MRATVAGRAGAAVRWRALQLGGVQVIYFFRLLVLAKLLAPDAFGLLAIATIAIGVLMRLSDTGTFPALVQRRDATPEEHDVAWTVGILRAGLVGVILVITAPIVARLFGEPGAVAVVQALAIRPLIDAAGSIARVGLTRELRFRELALIQVPGAIVDLIVAVATATTLGVWALVAGALAGSVATAMASYVFAPHRPRVRFRWEALAPLVQYGRWVFGAGVIALAGTLATQVAISRMLGAEALGLYFLAYKVAMLPVETTSSVVGSVAFPMFVELQSDLGATRRAFATLITGACLVLVPGYALIIVLAPLLEQALGARWAGSSGIIQLLSVAGVVGILGEIIVPLLMGRGRADRALVLEVVQTGLLLLVLVPCLAWLQVRGAAIAWLLGNLAAALLAVAWTRQMIPGALAGSKPRVLAATVTAVVAAAAAGLASGPFDGMTGLVAGGMSGVAAGALVLWWMNVKFDLNLDKFRMLLLGGGAGADERHA